MTTALTQHTITVNGLRTQLRQGGRDLYADEAVVFVHGNPGSGQDWAALMEATAPYARGIALDMPGFGQADKPADYPYSVEAGASFLTDALTQLGVRRAHLVLHDFGGPWGMTWALNNPDCYASLVLINTGVLKNYRWHYMARIWRTPILGELQQLLTTRWGFHKAIRHGCPRGLPDDFVNRMYDDLDQNTKRAILKLYRATGDLAERSAAMATAFKPISRPTLVVWGAADPYLPVHYAEQQRDTFVQAQVAVLPDSGHFPFADNPEAVADLVVPFLMQQLARAPMAAAG
ncbi:MAG: alpha/beta hydrolase [Burkholderiales bacterium]|nr:alpha/beta hydrolase [Burkholderiales bacterium]